MKSVLSTATLLISSAEAADWNYLKLGADWPAGKCVGGKNQSPIDFNMDDATDTYPRVTGDQFTKNYNNQAAVSIGFNGHTTQLGFDPKNGAMTFTSQISQQFGAPDEYNGAQFHFHAPSEHTVDGKLFDFEMHTVHFPKDTTQKEYAAAALGILFSVNEYTAELTWAEQKIIDQFFESLSMRNFDPKKPQVTWEVSLARYADLLNMVDTNNRWIYRGSVTTPPCATNVYWNELRTVYPISQKHVDQFKATLKAADPKVYSGDNTLDKVGNRREVQAVTPDHNVVVYEEKGRPDRQKYEKGENKGPKGQRGPGRYVRLAMDELGATGLQVGCAIVAVLVLISLFVVCFLAQKVSSAQKQGGGAQAPAANNDVQMAENAADSKPNNP